MSNRIFQNVIQQLKDVLDTTVSVIDNDGAVIASSDISKIGDTKKDICDIASLSSKPFCENGFTYYPAENNSKLDFVIEVEGDSKTSFDVASTLFVTLSNLKTYFGDKYDKGSFIKNIILDNILPSDIYIKAKELNFNCDAARAVFFVRFNDKGVAMPYELLQNIFPDKEKDYVLSISDSDVVIVKEVKPNCSAKELEKIAYQISDTINSEFFMKVTIGISTIAESIKSLALAFREAQVAIEVGKVFDTEKSIINYENLGIGRLIYQLPTTLCEMFLQEVFKKGALEGLDRETLMTIQAFFENNLNVSEASRKLFVHRNTLVYRLEKIKKLTGLDLREFDHAVTFKVALMVKKYLTSKPVKY